MFGTGRSWVPGYQFKGTGVLVFGDGAQSFAVGFRTHGSGFVWWW